MTRSITKLVLPVAGLGKRLRPLTFKIPKNLIPVNGKPMIEYVLEEAAESGIKEIVLIVNPANKKRFEEYVKKTKKRFSFKFHIRVQETPGGNGHALLSAYDLIYKEPFAVRFCDDVILSDAPVLKSLIKLFQTHKSPAVLLERIPKKMVSRYGVVAAQNVSSSKLSGSVFRITEIVEKPAVSKAPSNLIIIGGYILTPSILRNIKKVGDSLPGVAADALPIAVGLQIELIVGGKVYGLESRGRRMDCGTLESLRQTEMFLKNRKA